MRTRLLVEVAKHVRTEEEAEAAADDAGSELLLEEAAETEPTESKETEDCGEADEVELAVNKLSASRKDSRGGEGTEERSLTEVAER